ncbi:MAG: hypothetical protein ACYS21_20685, partial [Planctomycetota bacterium]
MDRLVPGQYPTIRQAMQAAAGGDTVVVYPKDTPYIEMELDFQGRAITVTSVNPDDPCCVAATIIDCCEAGRAFVLHSGEGHRSVISGLTIQNGRARNHLSSGWVPDPNTAGDRGPVAGGAIGCFFGASPTISNCVFKNCWAMGADGNDVTTVFATPEDPCAPEDPEEPNEAEEAPPAPDPDPGGLPIPGTDGAPGLPGAAGVDGPNGIDANDANDGGDGGSGYGGALYFDPHSNP